MANQVEVIPDYSRNMTKEFEGFRGQPYNDSRGIPTIGYGTNLNIHKNRIPVEVMEGQQSLAPNYADQLFNEMYDEAWERAKGFATPEIFEGLSPIRKSILADMSYNLGNKLFQFQNMQKAVQAGDAEAVKREMKNSKWYKQVGRRSKHHVRSW